jgi:hypothetical protein
MVNRRILDALRKNSSEQNVTVGNKNSNKKKKKKIPIVKTRMGESQSDQQNNLTVSSNRIQAKKSNNRRKFRNNWIELNSYELPGYRSGNGNSNQSSTFSIGNVPLHDDSQQQEEGYHYDKYGQQQQHYDGQYYSGDSEIDSQNSNNGGPGSNLFYITLAVLCIVFFIVMFTASTSNYEGIKKNSETIENIVDQIEESKEDQKQETQPEKKSYIEEYILVGAFVSLIIYFYFFQDSGTVVASKKAKKSKK